MIDLWDLARSANFTEKELESFRVRGRESVLPQQRRLAVPLLRDF